MERVDFILAGQGIAGSMLAFELLGRGKKIAIFDDSHRLAACLVAAGVLNPITGKRLAKSWKSDEALPFAKARYAVLENLTGAKFLHDRKILQLCSSEEEFALWQERRESADYQGFLSEKMPPQEWAQSGLNDSCGSFFINRSAWVEPPAAMAAFDAYLQSAGVLRREKFEHALLERSGPLLRYKDLEASRIIFAEGFGALQNPYFDWLPFRPAKGEILSIGFDGDFPNHIVHRHNWAMKAADGLVRVGSTWDRQNLNDIPTAAAREELLSAFKKIAPRAKIFEIAEHTAGVRPCTMTTLPFVGPHPEDARLLMLNGLGSKGYALSPYLAQMLCRHILDNEALDPQADLRRHARKFYKGLPRA